MAVPGFQDFMLPALTSLDGYSPRHWREVRDSVVERLNLSPEDQSIRLANGRTTVEDRTLWALTHLFQAGLVARPTRGSYVLTETGQELLSDAPSRLDVRYLERYPSFLEFKYRRSARVAPDGQPLHGGVEPSNDAESPEDLADVAERNNRAALVKEVLDRVLSESPAFLERLVLRVLLAMGYGATEQDLKHLGGSGDQGLDGVISRDPLGLDRTYVQAKRYGSAGVGRPDIQAFVGALHGAQTDRGVFITTSRFTREAVEYADAVQNRIVLIDGTRLAELMISYDVGVQVSRAVTLKSLDEDFFENF